MGEKKTSLLSNGLIWFGAAIAITEILAGTFIAPLGFYKGTAAIILGHFIGCVPFLLAGLIGGEMRKSAMETVKISFGTQGSKFFATLNVLQLLGWTAIMVIIGSKATSVLVSPLTGIEGEKIWCAVIGALIVVWLVVGVQNLDKLNLVAVGGLLVLSVALSMVVFRGGSTGQVSGTMSFGAAVELSAAMPISWLPLISDYTRFAKQPRAATVVSTIAYFIGSSWMYIIGLGAAIFTSQTDISQVMLAAGMGAAGIFIVIFSTVTTTFLDAYSAGVSFASIAEKVSEKHVAIAVCIIGTLLAMFTPIEQYENFLYLIGSVFAPMVAILITDFFILKQDHTEKTVNATNLLLWLAGFIIYRYFMSVDTVLGSTLPVMFITSILCILVNGGKKLCLKKS